MYQHIFITYSSVEGQLSHFHFLAIVIVSRLAINMDVQVFHSGCTSLHPPHQQ